MLYEMPTLLSVNIAFHISAETLCRSNLPLVPLMDANISAFERLESNVRRYCRTFPAVFARATGPFLYSESEEEYIDFFAGAGTLNFGHNHPAIKKRVLDYLAADGLVHGLDLYTTAKREFLERLEQVVLHPRGLDFKAQFCGPSGTEAVEAALKLARKIKGRQGIFSFMGAYHGLSMGSVAITGGRKYRGGQFPGVPNITFMPYPFGFAASFDTISYIDMVLSDACSGIDKPAAMVVECVQAEGGVCIAPPEWLKQLRALCDRHDILLICDEIQVGCHRTGPFFSFEPAGIVPDLIVLSKALSGFGSPMSLLLIRRPHDVWEPGEHAGTFRGNQLAFVGATAALEYARDSRLAEQVRERESFVQRFHRQELAKFGDRLEIRGRGLIWGIDFSASGGGATASQVSRHCFEKHLIAETAGRNGSVLKLLPPLNIDLNVLERGCRIVVDAIRQVL
jgi:diaminobutyrate-2-oxoglutarate transaminase